MLCLKFLILLSTQSTIGYMKSQSYHNAIKLYKAMSIKNNLILRYDFVCNWLQKITTTINWYTNYSLKFQSVNLTKHNPSNKSFLFSSIVYNQLFCLIIQREKKHNNKLSDNISFKFSVCKSRVQVEPHYN